MRNGGFWWLLLSWASFSSFCSSSSSSYGGRAINTPRKQTQVGWLAKNTENRSIIYLNYPDCPVLLCWLTWLNWNGLKFSSIFPSLVGIAMVLWEKVIFHLREAQGVCLLQLVVVITINMIADSFCCLTGRQSAASHKITSLIFHVLSQLQKGDNQVFSHYSWVVSHKNLRFLTLMDHKTLRPQQPNQHKRTSGDESRLCCRLILCASGPESWVWSQEKDYGQLTHTCSTYVKNSPYQQVAEVCINHSER